MSVDWANSGVDLYLEVAARERGAQERAQGSAAGDGGVLTGGRRAALEQALRAAIRDGRLTPGTRLPSTRDLARELGFARNTVSAAYEQLTAEGFLAARQGSGTQVAALPAISHVSAGQSILDKPPLYDLTPGNPDVTTFPVAGWLRSMRRALATAPASAYGYGHEAGTVELRTALAEYVGRSRGVIATPDQIVITSGYIQALNLLARLINGPIAMENPGLAFHREIVASTGCEVVALPVDERGARADLLHAMDVKAAIVTPAHQYPMGVTLKSDRRRILAEWAATTGGLIIEDDYDGEFRYDRQPVGAMQGAAPDHTVYIGTASKTLAPAIRLAWMVVPQHLMDPLIVAKRYSDHHTQALGQLAFADFIASHAFDRHVRSCRQRYRRRRDMLATLLGERVAGISAGLHALIPLPGDEEAVIAKAKAKGLALQGMSTSWQGEAKQHGIIAGFGTPPERLYPAALTTLALVLRGHEFQ